MCEPATLGLLFTGLSAGAAVYSATNQPSAPDMPAPTQDAQTPAATSYRKRNSAAVPSGARTPDTSTLLGSTGNAPSLARSTLLGQ